MKQMAVYRFGDSTKEHFPTNHLTITSPPYPMHKAWDFSFFVANPRIEKAFEAGRCYEMFNLMHDYLEEVWRKVYYSLLPGGTMAVIIGDTYRSLVCEEGKKVFRVYPNAAEIINRALNIGFDLLPYIIWWKPTNASTSFFGSGFIPPNMYVKQEHEYILLFRKGNKKKRGGDIMQRRKVSALSFEERNTFFNSLWRMPGEKQRGSWLERRYSFPLELARRLVLMYSKVSDTVFDPFAGSGTTLLAAVMNARRAYGFDFNPMALDEFYDRFIEFKNWLKGNEGGVKTRFGVFKSNGVNAKIVKVKKIDAFKVPMDVADDLIDRVEVFVEYESLPAVKIQ